MQRAFALVEGRTEETFVNQVLQPHLEGRGLWVQPVVLTTKRTAAGHKVSGGVSTWSKIERDLRNLLGDTDVVAVTTLLDYHAFPQDAPGMADRPAGGPESRVAHVEVALASELTDRRFVPYLSLHEFEALVLSAPNVLAGLCSNPGLHQQLNNVVSRYGGAEQVNETDPPSKWIEAEWNGYEKSLHGPLVTEEVGMNVIRRACPHFDAWIDRLEALTAP